MTKHDDSSDFGKTVQRFNDTGDGSNGENTDFGQTIHRGLPLKGEQWLFGGRYQLEERIGLGGMGEVWRALDHQLVQPVALKFLPELLRTDAEAVARLKEEAEQGRRLHHTHIVAIYDFLCDDQFAAIAMEYVDGCSLSELKAERPGRCFAPGQIRGWVDQLCEALDYAHEKCGLVHRDLKPANLLIDRHDQIRVTDFGLSQVFRESVTRRSASGRVAGLTPGFASPQQLKGERASPADDIYSLGATVYDLLTGTPPFFRGDFYEQTLHQAPERMAARRSGNASAITVEIPGSWEEAVAACLSKDPANRPSTAGEIPEILDHDSGERTTRKPGKKWLAATLAVAMIGGVGGGSWWWQEEQTRKEEIRRRAEDRAAATKLLEEADSRTTEIAGAVGKAREEVVALASRIPGESDSNALPDDPEIQTAFRTIAAAAGELNRLFDDLEVPLVRFRSLGSESDSFDDRLEELRSTVSGLEAEIRSIGVEANERGGENALAAGQELAVALGAFLRSEKSRAREILDAAAGFSEKIAATRAEAENEKQRIETLSSLQMPDSWKKIEEIHEECNRLFEQCEKTWNEVDRSIPESPDQETVFEFDYSALSASIQGIENAERSLAERTDKIDLLGKELTTAVTDALRRHDDRENSEQDWVVVKIDGRDYVSTENLRKFYRFPSVARDGDAIILEHPSLNLRLEAASANAFINNILYQLNHRVRKFEDEMLISTLDLAKVIDPVLRPSFIKEPARVEKVYLDSEDGRSESRKFLEKLEARLTDSGLKVERLDSEKSKQARAEAVSENSILISFDFDDRPSAARSLETTHLKPDDEKRRYAENVALASSVHSFTIHEFGWTDRGIVPRSNDLLEACDQPAVIMTVGSGSPLTDSDYSRLSEVIANGVAKFRLAVQGR